MELKAKFPVPTRKNEHLSFAEPVLQDTFGGFGKKKESDESERTNGLVFHVSIRLYGHVVAEFARNKWPGKQKLNSGEFSYQQGSGCVRENFEFRERVDEKLLALVPTPLHFHEASEDRAAVVTRLASEIKFLDRELAFLDVFTP